MDTLKKLWTEFDEQNVALHNALLFVYDCLTQIEVQYALLYEALIRAAK